MKSFVRSSGLVHVLLLAGLLLVMVSSASAQSCRKVVANRLGVPDGAGLARKDIVVSNTAVQVLPANTARCSMMLYNTSTNDMRCSDGLDARATDEGGISIPTGQGRGFEMEGQQAWWCIRTGANDATVNTIESLPE
jgi:hypothetical protein